MRCFRSLFPLLLLASLHGQTTDSPAPRPRSIAVVVHDKHGSPVASVNKDELQLVVDGKPVPITAFASDVEDPLLLGLVIDTNRRQRKVLAGERKPDEAFLEAHTARPPEVNQDQAFVIHYDNQIELMQDLTADHSLLRSGIEDLRVADAVKPDADREGDSGGLGDPDNGEENSHGRRSPAKDERLYDAIFLAADEILRKPKGRRVIVVVGSGVDHGSKESLASAVETAQRTGTVAYAIYVQGEAEPAQQNNRGNQNGQQRGNGGGIGWPGGGGGGWPGGGQSGGSGGGNGGGGQQGRNQKPASKQEDGKKILLEIASKTGGAMFEARKNDIAPALDAITQSLAVEYRLKFQPDAASTGDFHPVTVSATGKDWKVQAPLAYYTRP